MQTIEKTKEQRIEEMKKFLNANLGEEKDELLNYLIENNFFTSPASTKYHGNYEGGLYDHSFAVANYLSYLTGNLDLEWKSERSPFIVGMFHDLCKIESYKKLEDGTFDYNDVALDGHGSKSIMLLSQFIKLTEEEIYCIRFHMGAYEKDCWDNYDKAIRKYENVLHTHTADMYASKVLDC